MIRVTSVATGRPWPFVRRRSHSPPKVSALSEAERALAERKALARFEARRDEVFASFHSTPRPYL